jgi:hypothetical protein
MLRNGSPWTDVTLGQGYSLKSPHHRQLKHFFTLIAARNHNYYFATKATAKRTTPACMPEQATKQAAHNLTGQAAMTIG